MTPDDFLSDLAAIYARDPTGEAFGSGRLIAPGLVLTAGHVVDHPSREASARTGWKVCLMRERSETRAWVDPPHDAELVWRGCGDLDLALLRLIGTTTPAPKVRPVFAFWGETGSLDKVDAAGFPQAWRTEADAIRDYTLGGQLRVASQHEPYAWTVSPGDKPDSRDGWKGMSGGAVCKIGPDDKLHVLGVLQGVPANFSGGMLTVASLSAAFPDELFRKELRTSLGYEPRIVRYTPSVARPFHSTIPTLRNRPFVGREDLLTQIGASLGDPFRDAVVVLRGPAGVGKSELAQEFARRNAQAYPGGTFFLDGGGPLLAMGLARLGQIAFPNFPATLTLEDQGLWTLQALGAEPTLLIYDNVQSEAAVESWLPPAGMPCHVVMTTLLDRWDAGWLALDVRPLSREESVDLIERIAGRALASQYGARLAEIADGLPVQLVPASATLAYQARRGHADSASLALLDPKTQSSFRAPYQLLSPPAQLLLHAAARLDPQRIPSDELQRHMAEADGWSADEFRERLDACLDLQVLQGVGDLRMHQLFAKFVLGLQASADVATSLAAIVRTQAARMIEIAQKLRELPNRTDLAALLMAFSPDPERWAQGDGEVSITDGEVIGRALLEIGAFEAARPWYERVVAAKEQGDVHGVDQESLGRSLHQVGYCLASTGQFEAARPWFERAIAAKEQGDVHRRVDHDSLGGSLSQVGHCLVSTGQFDSALPWFERTVAAAEQGDVHGRVDQESIGVGLHQVGYCLSSTGRFGAARPWFERAIAAKERGDAHGRVDHVSLGGSLSQVGYCLVSTGQFEAALPWFERAVAAAEQGDVRRRVDQARIGLSLHEAGCCLACMGQFEAALPWLERAVAAKEQGDVHGRVDHVSLGGSLGQVGYCLVSTGQFEAALPWSERAVAAQEHGDVHGRVDHASLGGSLHQVGYCLSSTGRSEAALPWFERAVAAKEQGDVHGRVDHARISLSLHQVGYCLASTGQFDTARPWFERAVAAAEQGDVHGRVDHGSLGGSLHMVGHCLSRMGQFAVALPWFERAVAAMEQGDVHGRVNPKSLALSLRAGAACLAQLGRSAEAAVFEARASELSP